MDRKAFLQALDQALTKLVPARERAEMIRYYEEYFDDAGPEGEAAVIESLGDPSELAKKLAAEAGFNVSAAEPVRTKKRGRIVIAVAAILAGLVLLAVGVTILAAAVFNANRSDPDVRVTVEPMDAPSFSQNGGYAGDRAGESVSGQSFTVLDVEAAVANVTVQVGEEYGVELFWDGDGQYYLEYAYSGDVLRVTGSLKSVNGIAVNEASVLITVPEGAVLQEIDVEVGVGDVILANISAKDVSCDTGVGDMMWTGPLAREVELNTGMGDLSILTDAIDGWSVELNSGLGTLTVNGKEYRSRYQQAGLFGELEATTGMGSITLTCGG